jgi:hypothetical protein
MHPKPPPLKLTRGTHCLADAARQTERHRGRRSRSSTSRRRAGEGTGPARLQPSGGGGRAEVAHVLLATDAGGCGRGHRWQASTGSGGPRDGQREHSESTHVHGTDWLSSRWPKMAWPHEGGSASMAVPVATTTGGNWPRRAHAREEGRQGRHGGKLVHGWLQRTLVRTRSLIARPWRTSVRVLCMHRGREAVSEREWGNALVLLRLARHEREQQGGAEGMDTQRFGGDAARAWPPRHGARVGCLGIMPNTCRVTTWAGWTTIWARS